MGAQEKTYLLRHLVIGNLRCWLSLEWQSQASFAAGAAGSVIQSEQAAVAFGDLAAERKADAGAAGFGGEEGDEQVGRIREAGAFVLDSDL